ncbi:ribosomal protein S18 [Rhizopus microsporus var. microsporus]|uniref:Small ribosomal subunit protein bS18m n=1 Tax=Rhizopus microsporus var. microsporus TaxID=86635 RepID=A0A1X0QZH1_RHIZD|nr:ribosomal protein S18 [Rhizopus microsporus var. microsporus]
MIPFRALSTATKLTVSPVASIQVLSRTYTQKAGRSLEQETLSLLEDTIAKEKSRTTTESVQRYQKIHQEGDLYHPQDLNDSRYRESLRARRGKSATPTQDPFEVLDLNPLHEYKNYKLLSQFVSDIGKILPREQTGLSAKNQRKLAKAIKRARAIGLMSSTNNHSNFTL